MFKRKESEIKLRNTMNTKLGVLFILAYTLSLHAYIFKGMGTFKNGTLHKVDEE